MFLRLLDVIEFKEEDTMFIIGDFLDRGPHPIRLVQKLMEMDNVYPIKGNHEVMAEECMSFLMKEVTDETIKEFEQRMGEGYINWMMNDGDTTLQEFRQLDYEQKLAVMDYLDECTYYETVMVNNMKFLLVHAGLGNYRDDKDIDDYTMEEILFMRPDYSIPWFKDIITISGHTPTQIIEGNPNPGRIYHHNRHIVIDCGCYGEGGRMAALRLDDMKEYYVERGEG